MATSFLVIDGASAHRSFRGVETRNLVLAVLATTPPVDCDDCLVSLSTLEDWPGGGHLVALSGRDCHRVHAKLVEAFDRLGIAVRNHETAVDVSLSALAKARDGCWVDPS